MPASAIGGSVDESQPSELRRYTNLAVAVHLLHTKRLTLLDPVTWDDRNDAHFLKQYKDRKNAKAMLALCFFTEAERYHHWRIYASGMDGVCIEFNGRKLLSKLMANCDILPSRVRYRTVGQIRRSPPNVDDLPFLKRYAYKDEQEYRILYTDADQLLTTRDCEIDMPCIRTIILSPWLPPDLTDSLKHTLRRIAGCSRLPIKKSTVVDNETWKEFATEAPSRERTHLEDSLTALHHSIMFLAIAAGGQSTAATYAHEDASRAGKCLSDLGDNHVWEHPDIRQRIQQIANFVTHFARALQGTTPQQLLEVSRRIHEELPPGTAAGNEVLENRCGTLVAALRKLAEGAEQDERTFDADVLTILRSV